MALLTGLTPDGLEVPVQVKPDGKLVAEGLTGPAGAAGPQGDAGPVGPQGDDKWSGSSNISYLGGKVGIGVSAPTASGGILQLSGGITFPAAAVASADPNTLDDYEEGTWTVSMFDAATAGNTSATTATGDYAKTGNTVRATFSINKIDTTGLTAGNVLHFSLPFQHAATYESTGTCAFGLVTLGAGYTILNSFITANAGRGFFLTSGNNIAFGNAPVSWFKDDAVNLRVTITYKAA